MKIFIKIAAIYMNFFTLITSVLLCTLTVFRSKKKNKNGQDTPVRFMLFIKLHLLGNCYVHNSQTVGDGVFCGYAQGQSCF